MKNESVMHQAMTSYLSDCGCNKRVSQESNNEEHDILVLPTDEPGEDVTELSDNSPTKRVSIAELLEKSMAEEDIAFEAYIYRAYHAHMQGDEESMKLWDEIAADESEHHKQFAARLAKLSGSSIVGSGIDDRPLGDITAFTGSYPGKKNYIKVGDRVTVVGKWQTGKIGTIDSFALNRVDMAVRMDGQGEFDDMDVFSPDELRKL